MESGEFHPHCLRCFDASCPSVECPLVGCPQCRVPMHECKMEDHREVCPLEWRPCLLEAYGCAKKIRRDHVAVHLLHCSAFVIRCNFTWDRRFFSTVVARRFKKAVKGVDREEAALVGSSDELDRVDVEVGGALHDQRQVWRSFRCSRACRFKQRQQTHGRHPVLPMLFEQQPSSYLPNDSSDEEELDRLAVMRSKPQAFANCPICAEAPGEQHLHILGKKDLRSKMMGGGDEEEEEKPSQIPLSTLLPPLNLECGLFMETESCVINVKGRLVHGFICGRLLRRDEFDEHHRFHTDISHADERFQRCPLGCGFGVEKWRPKSGTIGFESFFDQFVHRNVGELPTAPFSLELDRFLLVVRIAAAHLDAASLNALAATNSKVRRFLFAEVAHRLLVWRKWQKMRWPDGRPHWEMTEVHFKFSIVQSPVPFVPNFHSRGELEAHRAECPLADGLKTYDLPLLSVVENNEFMAEMFRNHPYHK
ncbi:hypothetical protein M3Y99_00094800 [Aphelenchoides fujianensis]|nr:hypothetical protein M3Y99_00094800 [Aphelenchoides fujianensis]